MQGLFSLQYFVDMLIWLDAVPDLTHNAIFIDQKGLPVHAHELLAVQVLLFIDIV